MDENQKTCCEISALLDDESQCDLAMQYLRRRGAAKDVDKAIRLLQDSAARIFQSAVLFKQNFISKAIT